MMWMRFFPPLPDRVWLMASDPNAPEGRRYIGKEEIGPH